MTRPDQPAADAARNVIQTDDGRQSAVCEFCGRTAPPARPTRQAGTRLSLFDLPQGWASAPYPDTFVHPDGSTGTQWSCPTCNRRLDAGESLYSRQEPQL